MARTVLTFAAGFMALWMVVTANAQPSNLYTFESPAQQQQFQQLTEQLRCLVCQNESLWDSSAPLAKDLRWEIYQQIAAGKNDADIKHYLVARYGQFILFKPSFTFTNLLLWLVPFLLLGLGFLVVILVALRAKKNADKGILKQ